MPLEWDGPCTPARHTMGSIAPEVGSLTEEGRLPRVRSMTGVVVTKGSREGNLRLDHLLN